MTYARPDRRIPRVPLQPLSDYIARLGGPRNLPATGVRFGHLADPTCESDRTEEELTRVQWLEGQLAHARRYGDMMSMYTADEICCDYLRVHPTAVYGDAWYDFGVPLNANMHGWINRFVGAVPTCRVQSCMDPECERSAVTLEVAA